MDKIKLKSLIRKIIIEIDTENKKGLFVDKRHKLQSFNNGVLQYSKDGIFIKEFDRITDASRSLGIHKSAITRCAKGGCKTAGGFVRVYK